jgi:type IV fimbrial biogenesis protein FimT
MKKRPQSGFTLYELLITVLIVGVVLTLGIPNLTEFTRNSRITATANDLHASFMMARSESARAKTNITICASADGAACGGTWDQGYIVFVDLDGNIAVNGVDETILRTHGPAEVGVSMAVANGATFFSYAATGMGRGNVLGFQALSQVVICDERGTAETSLDQSAARLFVATPLGRATIVRDFTTVETALGNMGLTCP